jgi:hypothetical protein
MKSAIIASILLLQAVAHVASVNWQFGNWAFACDFPGNDLSNKIVPGEQCGGLCASTGGCTHFTWTSYNGGTCWMKSGSVSKSSALDTGDNSMVCGIVGTADNTNHNTNTDGTGF